MSAGRWWWEHRHTHTRNKQKRHTQVPDTPTHRAAHTPAQKQRHRPAQTGGHTCRPETPSALHPVAQTGRVSAFLCEPLCMHRGCVCCVSVLFLSLHLCVNVCVCVSLCSDHPGNGEGRHPAPRRSKLLFMTHTLTHPQNCACSPFCIHSQKRSSVHKRIHINSFTHWTSIYRAPALCQAILDTAGPAGDKTHRNTCPPGATCWWSGQAANEYIVMRRAEEKKQSRKKAGCGGRLHFQTRWSGTEWLTRWI